MMNMAEIFIMSEIAFFIINNNEQNLGKLVEGRNYVLLPNFQHSAINTQRFNKYYLLFRYEVSKTNFLFYWDPLLDIIQQTILSILSITLFFSLRKALVKSPYSSKAPSFDLFYISSVKFQASKHHWGSIRMWKLLLILCFN